MYDPAPMGAHHFPPHLRRRFVGPESNVNCLSQQPVGGPRQIGYLDDQFWLNPMNSEHLERRAKTGLARRRRAERRSLPRQGLKAPLQVGEHLVRHSRADPAGIDRPAVSVWLARGFVNRIGQMRGPGETTAT